MLKRNFFEIISKKWLKPGYKPSASATYSAYIRISCTRKYAESDWCLSGDGFIPYALCLINSIALRPNSCIRSFTKCVSQSSFRTLTHKSHVTAHCTAAAVNRVHRLCSKYSACQPVLTMSPPRKRPLLHSQNVAAPTQAIIQGVHKKAFESYRFLQ